MAFAPFTTAYTPEPTRCAGGVRPGTRILQDWACDESPWGADLWDVGTYVCRTIAGSTTLSAHASGRAGDSGHNIINGASHPSGIAFANWLVANHAVLGVQEVICNRRRWTLATGWRAYGGVSPHVDHVHWTLNSSGGTYLTRARILSVAPRKDPLMALSDAEADELLAKVRNLTKQVDALQARRVPTQAVVRRTGSTGMNTVSLVFGPFRLPLATQAQADAFKYVLGQPRAVSWPPALFDPLHVLT